MPKIKITEQDLTRSTSTSVLDTVVYVPGPCDTTGGALEPTLCRTSAELAALTTATGSTKIDSSALSYRLAQYLLDTFKVYVLYEGIGKAATKVPASSWTRLRDINTYDITFLTTGQYGYVDANAANCAGARGDCTYLADIPETVGDETSYELLKEAKAPEDWPTSEQTFPNDSPYYSYTQEGGYVSLAGKPYQAYAANTFYKIKEGSGTWVGNVRLKFTDAITASDSYCAGFAPWFVTANPNLIASGQTTQNIPGAFGALFAYARMIKSNYPWFAAAGALNGLVPEAKKFVHQCSNAECEILQARSKDAEVGLDEAGDNLGMAINPIAEVKPFGNIVWGYRTTRINTADGLKATSFLNVRILVNILKKYLRQIARKYTFQQNDEVLWTNFSSEIISILDYMKSGRGIADYEINKVATNAKARLKATITIIPIEPVEDFELEIDLTDSLNVSE